MQTRDRGSIMIECILVFPLILLIAICSVEFTRCLRAIKIAQSLSREMASAVFRECASVRDLRNTTCLQDIQTQFNNMAVTIDNRGNANGESSFVMATVFVREGDVNYQAVTTDPSQLAVPRSWPACCKIFAETAGSCTDATSCQGVPNRIAADVGSRGSTLRAFYNVLVVGQAFVRHKSLLAPVANLFGSYNEASRYFSDATVI